MVPASWWKHLQSAYADQMDDVVASRKTPLGSPFLEHLENFNPALSCHECISLKMFDVSISATSSADG